MIARMSEMETPVRDGPKYLGGDRWQKWRLVEAPGVEWAFDPSAAQTDATDIDIGR
jgi:hypothetical protein